MHLKALGISHLINLNTDLTGMSDWDVLKYYANSNNINEKKLSDSFNDIDEIQREIPPSDFVPCKGVNANLISSLSRNWKNYILTGNTLRRAIYKLSAIKLNEFFSKQDIYACEKFESRIDIAKRAYEAVKGEFKNILIIGDTLHDINVAKQLNVKVLSVATGDTSVDSLKSRKPDLLLENLDLTPSKLEIEIANIFN